MLGNSEVFVVHASRKASLIEGLDCGCLTHATIVVSLGPFLWVVLVNVCLERKESRDCGVKLVLGICLETTM